MSNNLRFADYLMLMNTNRGDSEWEEKCWKEGCLNQNIRKIFKKYMSSSKIEIKEKLNCTNKNRQTT